MILAALFSSVLVLHPLPSHFVYPVRNADVARDAVARTLDDRRALQGYRGALPRVQIVRDQFATSADLTKLGFLFVQPSRTFMLVQVEAPDAERRMQVDSYAYDPVTHLVRYEMHKKLTTSSGTRTMSPQGCPLAPSTPSP